MPLQRRHFALFLGGLLVLCGGTASLSAAHLAAQEPADTQNTVHLYASDFAFVLDRTIIPPGPVEFELLNTSGEYRHEVWIYPIDERDSAQFHEMLHLKRTGERASEPDFIRGIVARSGEVEAGQGAVFTANLPPGVYEVACLARDGEGNMRTVHYDDGMFAALVVRAPTP